LNTPDVRCAFVSAWCGEKLGVDENMQLVTGQDGTLFQGGVAVLESVGDSSDPVAAHTQLLAHIFEKVNALGLSDEKGLAD
ncbi:MAG: hypothetical protein WAX89_03125, partial [Alphaproteobacteria bacterium]